MNLIQDYETLMEEMKSVSESEWMTLNEFMEMMQVCYRSSKSLDIDGENQCCFVPFLNLFKHKTTS